MEKSKLKTLAIIQARMGSTRLPGKVLMSILDHPMLWHIVQRLRYVSQIEEIVVATSNSNSDKQIVTFCNDNDINVFAGSENDVLDRFYQAARHYKADNVIRITGDCPLVDPDVIGKLLDLYDSGRYDHVGVATGAGAIFLKDGRFPNGIDAECFSFSALKRAWEESTELSDREHVTPYIWRSPNKFRLATLKSDKDYYGLRFSVDYKEDFKLITLIYNGLYREGEPFLLTDVINYINKNPELIDINRSFVGREGYDQLWRSDQSGKVPNRH